jgi:hypothetical protein
MSDTIQNRDIMKVDADARDMRYFGRNKGSDCQFGSPFLGSLGYGVHANRKYRFKWLFLKNIDFNHDLNLQFSGLSGVTLFCHRFQVKKVIKGLRKTAIARQFDHVGELWVLAGLPGFFASCEKFCCVWECVPGFHAAV